MILTHYIIARRDLTVGAGAVAHVAIRETDGPHAGHLMAVGLGRHPNVRSRIV